MPERENTMSTQDLAEALLRMLRNDSIAAAVQDSDLSAFADLNLSQQEREALLKKINRWEYGLVEVGTVGAWGLVTRDLANVHPSTKDQLNRALAARQLTGPAIPCTGS
jgi:hypothetical protein